MQQPAPRHLSLFTAICLVIANMIGSGVYTSLGFQLGSVTHYFSIMMLWIIGGIIALSGALVYAALAVEFPSNGGEMNFLTRLYNPTTGFLAGWVSTLAGFTAPVAIVCTAIGKYGATIFTFLPPQIVSILVLLVISYLHAHKRIVSTRFHQFSTILNICIILFLIISASIQPHPQPISILPTSASLKEITGSGNFAVSLYWVIYAYTGWNAATYIAGEIKHPNRNLPIALLAGTVLVTILYLLLNYAFLLSAPAHALRNQIEIGFIAAKNIFGKQGAVIMSICICITLVSTASAMTFSGPRVTAAMGNYSTAFQWLNKKNEQGLPYIAIYFQSGMVLVLLLLNRFHELIDLVGFLLATCTSLAVAGYFMVKKRKPVIIQISAIVFLCINLWITAYGLYLKPYTSLGGLVIIAFGYIIWRKTAIKSI